MVDNLLRYNNRSVNVLPYNYDKNVPNINSPSQISLQNEVNVKYSLRHYYFTIDSRNRDITSYPHVNSYKIDIPIPYKNVNRIELIGASIPNQGSPLNEPYLILSVDELNHVSHSNGYNYFTIMPLKGANQTIDGFIHPELACSNRAPNVFQVNNLAKINKLTISIYKGTGELFDFGESAGDVSSKYSNFFEFKITCSVADSDIINARNVF